MFRSLTKLGAQTHTIAYLADGFLDPYQVEIVQGLLETARSGGANLLCFVGGPLPLDPQLSDGRHAVYDLATSAVCDGFVVSGTGLNHEVGTSGLLAFSKRLGDAPACTVGVLAEGLVTVNPDNERGMERVVTHLIEAHGAKRIALVRGPRHNDEAEARERAFRSAHNRSQLPVEERLIVAGDFSFESGVAAVAELASTLGTSITDLDAIVASNDRMAMGALLALHERGISVPGDLAVTGFDDIAEAELTHPPLSTARQAMPRLGREAMRLVLEQVRHGTKGKSQILDVEMVLRRSCGCSGLAASESSRSLDAPGFGHLGGGLLFHRERIHLELTRVSRGTLGAAGRGWEQRLFASMVDALQQSDDTLFLKTLQALAERLLRGTSELNRLDEVVQALRQQLVPLFGDAKQADRARLEVLIHSSRTMLFEMSLRAMHNDRIGLLRRNRNVAAICNRLSCAFDYGELQEAIRTSLPLLGIRGAFVALYDPKDSEHARLLCAFDAETDLSPFQGQLFLRRALLPPTVSSASGQRGRSYTVHALVWRGQLLGHLLLELELISLPETGALAAAIAGGLQRAALAGSPPPPAR
ncbi:MAG TPA: substrate-binding domain-containing protein [Polyangiaceae bacterium]|nr:substrate-binding domain-containing protein [Polyangiaceae bacterium]